MAGGRPVGSINTQRPFADALRMELAAAGDNHRELRLIARNLIALAKSGEPSALQAIREIADRCDGKPRHEAEVTLRGAIGASCPTMIWRPSQLVLTSRINRSKKVQSRTES
jgi:hypothetical protein